MDTSVVIRPERPTDADAVRAVNVEAFGRPDEARLVDRLRERARPYLGLVAADRETVVGHIVFAPVTLHCYQAPYTITALAPMPRRCRPGRTAIGASAVIV